MVDADRVEHLAEPDGGPAEVDLVVSNSDVVIGVPVDDRISTSPGGTPISSSLRAAPTAAQSPANPAPSTRMRAILCCPVG